MTPKDRILGRIREGLRLAAPRPGSHGGHGNPAHAPRAAGAGSAAARAWLPPGGATVEERADRFRSAAAELGAEFLWLDGIGAAAAAVGEMAARLQWRRVASHHGALTDPAAAALGCESLWVDGGSDRTALEACDAGITECEALIAQTGSVVVSSQPAGRVLSSLPPHHVVLARRDQLVGTLADAFDALRRRRGADWPSMISFITGPSRTGDIERILVLGAHGPKRLTILVC